jgi:signal transduction histidine kinase
MEVQHVQSRRVASNLSRLSLFDSLRALAHRLPLRALSRLSVRRRTLIALVVLVALACAQWVISLVTLDYSAFLLKRAEVSYKQLRQYQQLSIDDLDYILMRRGTGVRERSDSVKTTIQTDLERLRTLIAYERTIVRGHGGGDENDGERDRFDRINEATARIFAEQGADGAVEIYHASLQPLLGQAIEGEQGEVASVEQAMRSTQRRMRWVGAAGVAAQALVLLFIMIQANRTVLNPLSRLVEDIRQYGRGRLGHRVAVDRHDEFGLLSHHINRMARQLERQQQSLIDANDRLEAIVAERTRSLREKNDELREVDERRRRFFADVSHELRTPLTAILGEADVTLRINPVDGEAYRDSLRAILANGALLNRRVDDLLALARSSDGQLRLQQEIVDLNNVAADAVAEVGALAKINDVTIRFDALPTALLVHGDRMRLKQTLLILLDNAIKFSPPSQTVEVVLANQGEIASVVVSNRGPGVAASEIPRLFERYYQTEDGQRMGGTGLGLAIASRIVEAHRGTICVASAANEGAMISMTFPTITDAQP